jgi:hypothetical protein
MTIVAPSVIGIPMAPMSLDRIERQAAPLS